MMNVHCICLRVLFAFLVGFLLISCESTASSDVVSQYERLCTIYEEVVARPVELGMKEASLVQRVQNELPEFYKKYYTHIATADADQRYTIITKLAEQETKSRWSCKVMESYYKKEFNIPTNN